MADDPQREVTMSVERLHNLVYGAVGAASVPFMRDNPSYVMPSEELGESTAAIMREFGVEPIEGFEPDLPEPNDMD